MATPTIDLKLPGHVVMHDHSVADLGVVLDSRYAPISVVNYTLPTASASVLGGIKVGDRLSINTGVLSADVQTTDITGKASLALDNLASVAINTSLISDTDSTDDLGSSSKYWANTYTDKLYLNATATLDGSVGGVVTLAGKLNLTAANLALQSGGVDAFATKSANVWLGLHVGNLTGSGDNNFAVGNWTFTANTTGYSNVALGAASGAANTEGHDNLAIGVSAMNKNTTGIQNVAIGASTLLTNVIGSNNMAIGAVALRNSTTSNNVAVGAGALNTLTTGANNIAIGFNCLTLNSTGSGNVGIGYEAGLFETGSSKLFIDNARRTNEADGRVKALIYGVFASTTAAQYLTINGNLTVLETFTILDKNIVLGTTTGTKIGTGTTQKLGFWNVTPVVQPTHIADPTGGAVVDAEARTAITSINAMLATLGLTAAT